MWHRTAAFVIKYRVTLLLLLLGVTAVMGWYGRKVELNYGFNNAVPTDNPKYLEYQEFRKQFGEDGNLMVIGVQTDKFFEPGFFTAYSKLAHELEGVKIDHVDSMRQVPAIENVLGVPQSINLIRDTVSGKLKTEAIFTGSVTPQQVDLFHNLPFYKGFLYNPQTHTYLMALKINKLIMDKPERIEAMRKIKEICDAFSKANNIELHYSGLPYIRTEMATLVRAEMKMFLIMSFVLTAVILLLFFRSIIAVLASMVVVAAGVIWSVGTLALFQYKITILTALIPPLIVVIGIPNCVYFLNKYHSEYHITGHKIKSLMRMVDRMGIVTLFTNITAAIGFGVFFFTKSTLLREFGLVAGLNIIGIFFISLIFIPALFSFLPPPHGKHTSYLESKWMTRMLNMLTTWVFSYRKWIYVVTIVACVVSVLGMMRLQNVGHIVDDLPKEDKVYRDLKFFENNFHGVMPLEIVVDTKKKRGATSLDMFVKADELNDYLKTFPEIGHALSLSEGVKFANQGYNQGDSLYFAVPDQFGAVFLSSYLSGGGGDKNGMFNKLVNSFVDSTKSKTRISINIADVGSQRLPVLLDSIRPKAYAIFDTTKYKLTFTGTSIVFLEGSRFIINSLRDSLILAFVMIFGCMIFLFRSWRILLISVVVNIVPLLITAGIMGWMNIAIKPSTVLVFSIALGITIDVTIRFLVSFKQEMARHKEDIPSTVRRTIHDTGLSIIYTSLILIAGFGVFSLSHFDGTKALGYLTSLTLLLAMVTNLTLQPALLLWMAKKQTGENPDWMKEEDEADEEEIKA